MAVALFAWLLHVAALAFAPLSVVQAVLSTGVVILAVLADRLFGFEVARRQWLGVGLTAVGLVLLVRHAARALRLALELLAGRDDRLRVGAARGRRAADQPARAWAPRTITTAIMLGAAAGVLFGVSDVAIKALTGVGRPATSLLVSPWLAVAALASVVAFYASARGLQDGEAVPVIASTSTAANVSCIVGGIVVFGDPDALGRARDRRPGHRLRAGRRGRAGDAAADARRDRLRPKLAAEDHLGDLSRVVPGRHVPAAGQDHVAGLGQQPPGAGALAAKSSRRSRSPQAMVVGQAGPGPTAR